MRTSTRKTVVFALLISGIVGLALGLVAPVWSFTYWNPGNPSTSQTLLFSVGPPGAYFRSPVLGSGPTPPPQATLDLDIALWVNLALGIVAGIVAIGRSALAVRRESAPALTHGSTVAATGLAGTASVLLLAVGRTAYAAGTWCPTCTAVSGQGMYNDWSWTLGIGGLGILIAVGAYFAALVFEAVGPSDPTRWIGRIGGAGVVAGVALFSAVFGNNWQAWYPLGTPYVVLWVLIVSIPVASTGFAIRAVRRTAPASPPLAP